MGHGIYYCASCQQQLRDPDFEKEVAYHLEGHPYCEGCARQLIHTLPEDRMNDILRTFESTQDEAPHRPPPVEGHGTRTTRILKALSGSPGIRILTSTSRRMATVPPESQSSASLLIGIGVAVLVLVVLAIYGVASDSSSRHAVPSTKSVPRR